MSARIAALVLLILAVTASRTLAAPPRQGPGEEPTKAPYVFPTPIDIPTFPADTPAPKATAAPTRATLAATLTGEGTYTVQSGDSPWTIAQKLCGNGTKSTLIMNVNNIGDPSKIRVGTVLKIPAECSGAPTAPTVIPTAPPVLPSPLAPTPVETMAPTRTPTLTANGSNSSSVTDFVTLGLNVASGILFVGSVLSGLSAYAVYRRMQFIEQMTNMTKRLRIRK